jgi:hypothetical protein
VSARSIRAPRLARVRPAVRPAVDSWALLLARPWPPATQHERRHGGDGLCWRHPRPTLACHRHHGATAGGHGERAGGARGRLQTSGPPPVCCMSMHVLCTGAIFVHFTVLRRSCTLRRMIPCDPRRNKYNEDVVVLATLGPRLLATIDGAGFKPFTTIQPVAGGPPPDDGGAVQL